MKALVCSAYGDPESLEIGELPDPVAGPDQVIIEVEFAGVSFVDTLTIRDRHQNPHPVPFAPGMEVVGRIVSHGGDVLDPRLSVGQRVAALTYDGGFAERARADAREVFPLPAGVAGDVAAGCLSVYLSAYLALHDVARLVSEEILVVTGAAGGVGLGAVEIGAAHGARVVACASSAQKLQVASERGASDVVDYATNDLKQQLKALAPEGVDVVLDVLGGELGEAAFRALGWGGRFVTVGFAAGSIPSFPANLLLVKNRAALGFALMHYRKHAESKLQEAASAIFAMIADGRIRPLIRETGALEQGPLFLRQIMDRSSMGKTVLKLN